MVVGSMLYQSNSGWLGHEAPSVQLPRSSRALVVQRLLHISSPSQRSSSVGTRSLVSWCSCSARHVMCTSYPMLRTTVSQFDIAVPRFPMRRNGFLNSQHKTSVVWNVHEQLAHTFPTFALRKDEPSARGLAARSLAPVSCRSPPTAPSLICTVRRAATFATTTVFRVPQVGPVRREHPQQWPPAHRGKRIPLIRG